MQCMRHHRAPQSPFQKGILSLLLIAMLGVIIVWEIHHFAEALGTVNNL